MIVRLLGAPVARGFLGAAFSLPFLVAACSDDPAGPSAEVRTFCQQLFASPAFACCTAADRSERQFAARNRYQSEADCTNQLGQASAQGRRAFDSAASQSCLSHLAGRTCGVAPTTTVRAEEEAAGCGRVLQGLQNEGQSCLASEDCKPGLVCPPARETGFSACAKPASINQGCVGTLPKNSIDHPPCEKGLVCSFVSEAPACPLPPCLIFQCIPLGEENEACTGLDCAEGLKCLTNAGRPVCTKSTGLSPTGGPCRVADHCADGLYCNVASGTCAKKKAAGDPCVSPLNALLECEGFCQGEGESGVCAAFCGSE